MQSVDCHYRSTDGQPEELDHLWIKMSAIMKEYQMPRLLFKFHICIYIYASKEKKEKRKKMLVDGIQLVCILENYDKDIIVK